MKIVGLITEYNPFHKGHEFHIEQALKVTGADKVIVVMSGDFVQRGEPAIMPKHLRAKMALHSGVSLVLELPTRFSTASAEYFSAGAVDLLNRLACVDSLCFGSECGDISDLTNIASILLDEPADFKALLTTYLKKGLSFPKSRQLALEEYCLDKNINGKLLSQPNNILGVEYIKALIKSDSKIKPYTIKRETNNYHDEDLGAVHSSATSIRKIITTRDEISNSFIHTNPSENISNHQVIKHEKDSTYHLLSEQLPSHALDIMKEHYNNRYPICYNDFSLLLQAKLLNATPASLMNYLDVNQELANRIVKYRNQFIDTNQFIELLKSKNITRSRISRCLLHILLEISDFDNKSIRNTNHYARVLGFSKDDSQILTLIRDNSSLPIITKLNHAESILSADVIDLFLEDINSSNQYELVVSHKFKKPYIPEPQKSMIII